MFHLNISQVIVCRIYILWSFAPSQFSGVIDYLIVETIPNAKLMPDDFLMPGKSSTAKHQFCANMNKQNIRWREYDIARKKYKES